MGEEQVEASAEALVELERELEWRRATRTAFVELYQWAGLQHREAELVAAVRALLLAITLPGHRLTVIGRRKMEPLLDSIADALRRQHEMLAEMELLAEEFQDQVKAMRMMDSKLQRHMQRLEKEDGAAAELPSMVEMPHEGKLPRDLEPPHEVKLPRDGNLSRFLKGRPQPREE